MNKLLVTIFLLPLLCSATVNDIKPVTMRVMGVREISAVSPTVLRIIIGPSATNAATEPLAYRIISKDDAAYCYEDFVTPQSVSVNIETELNLPDGFSGNRNIVSTALTRTVVELTLPSPMIPGKNYGVVAIGKNSEMITAAKTGAELTFDPDQTIAEPTPLNSPEVMQTMGLRKISSIGNGIIQLDFGHAFAAPLSTIPGYYTIKINGKKVSIVNIGRRSRPDLYLPIGWPYRVFQHHEIYLQLDQLLNDGDKITVKVSPQLTTGNTTSTMHFNKNDSISSALKVNQVGYLPKAIKNGFLGRYLGSFPEQSSSMIINPALLFGENPTNSLNGEIPLSASALKYNAPPFFEIIDEKNGKSVFRKQSTLKHNGSLPDGNINYSGENVYLLDFTEFNTPGRYFITVDNTGRSFSFAISSDVYQEAFAAQATGLLMQRCGQELKEPYSNWRRIACHASGIVPTTEYRYTSDSLWGNFLKYQLMRENPDFTTLNEKRQNLLDDPTLITKFSNEKSGEKEIKFNPQAGVTLFFRFTKGFGTQKYGGELISLGGLKIAVSWGVWNLYLGNNHNSYQRVTDGETHFYILDVEPLQNSEKYRTRLFCDGKLGSEVYSDSPPGTLLKFGNLSNALSADAFISDLSIYNRIFSQQEIELLSSTIPQEIPESLATLGGHHDAGDYNPRAHLDVAQLLMSVYEAAPQKFYDGQLNIPENNNSLPDILDEAFWALRLWIGLQRPDGAIYHGTGSLWDVNFIQTVEMDNSGDYAWAVDAGSSFSYAGAMAQASRVLKKFFPELSQECLVRARMAYGWGMEHKPQVDTLKKSAEYYIAPRAYAAAELLHSTGEKLYADDFIAYTPWNNNPNAPIQSSDYDLTNAAYSYINLPPELGSDIIKQTLIKLIKAEADSYIKCSSLMAYPFLRHPDAPIDWGTGSYETYARPVWQMWLLTGDKKYYNWMIHTADNTLGANPLGMCWITGLGTQKIHAPLHSSRYRPAGVAAAGLQCQGPNMRFNSYSCPESVYPAIQRNYAVLYNFADMHFAIGMNEGTTSNMIKTLALFGLLLPDR